MGAPDCLNLTAILCDWYIVWLLFCVTVTLCDCFIVWLLFYVRPTAICVTAILCDCYILCGSYFVYQLFCVAAILCECNFVWLLFCVPVIWCDSYFVWQVLFHVLLFDSGSYPSCTLITWQSPICFPQTTCKSNALYHLHCELLHTLHPFVSIWLSKTWKYNSELLRTLQRLQAPMLISGMHELRGFQHVISGQGRPFPRGSDAFPPVSDFSTLFPKHLSYSLENVPNFIFSRKNVRFKFPMKFF